MTETITPHMPPFQWHWFSWQLLPRQSTSPAGTWNQAVPPDLTGRSKEPRRGVPQWAQLPADAKGWHRHLCLFCSCPDRVQIDYIQQQLSSPSAHIFLTHQHLCFAEQPCVKQGCPLFTLVSDLTFLSYHPGPVLSHFPTRRNDLA